jgi:hypothetical protein
MVLAIFPPKGPEFAPDHGGPVVGCGGVVGPDPSTALDGTSRRDVERVPHCPVLLADAVTRIDLAIC